MCCVLTSRSLPLSHVCVCVRARADLSMEHGLLASASDEQVLTFLDMRAD